MARPQRELNKVLESAKAQAMRQLGTWLDARFTEEISAVKWEFPTPPTVRDVVDTGRLRASQTRVANPDGSVTFTWPVEYAGQVHEGGVSTTGLLSEAPAKFGELLRSALEGQQ
jgi:hypothetical protein